LFATLRDTGELTVRVWQSLPGDRFEALMESAVEAGVPVASGPRPAEDLLRVGYVKVFMDGTLGSRTARLLDGSGIEITSCARLAEIILSAASVGLPVAVHAIGDRANREALDAFAATEADWRPLGLRHRIEYAQCVDPDDLPRFALLGVTASVQFTHATSDQELADRIWGARAANGYPYRSLLDAGARVAAGSDAPMEQLDPVAGLRAAVHRTVDDRPPWRPEQSIGLTRALRSFTCEPAWLERAEDRRGMLRAGLAADLVVLDRDPFADLDGARVIATMLAGRWLHAPAGYSRC
jgi:predicted amidohydrolase YtcJ